MALSVAILRPFDAVSTALYAAAFRAGRGLSHRVRARCGEASLPVHPPPPPVVEPATLPALPVMSNGLPGVTIEGIDPEWIEPTPENSFIVDLCAVDGDVMQSPVWPDVLDAVAAGKAVLFGDIAADRGLFSIGKVDGRYLVCVGLEAPSIYADLDAAMRYGFRSIEGWFHA